MSPSVPALTDGPSVLGWARWREVCQQHVFGLVQALLADGIEAGRIRARARAEMIEVLGQFIDSITA